jgi:hypothetical protein
MFLRFLTLLPTDEFPAKPIMISLLKDPEFIALIDIASMTWYSAEKRANIHYTQICESY